jgi:hypothetical protein
MAYSLHFSHVKTAGSRPSQVIIPRLTILRLHARSPRGLASCPRTALPHLTRSHLLHPLCPKPHRRTIPLLSRPQQSLPHYRQASAGRHASLIRSASPEALRLCVPARISSKASVCSAVDQFDGRPGRPSYVLCFSVCEDISYEL